MRRVSYPSHAAQVSDLRQPSTRLAKRVEPIVGESLMSLLTRCTIENGYRKIADILVGTGAIELSHIGHTPFVNFDYSEQIASRLALSASKITALMHAPAKVEGWGTSVNWFGTVLPRHFIDARTRRVSPRAFRDSQHHRAEWMIRPLTFCPETMENLIDACNECGHRLSWWSSCGLWRCEKCEKSLRRALPGKVPWKYRTELRLVSGLVSPNPVTRSQALAAFPTPFSNWEAGEVFTAVVELGVLASKLPDTV